MNEKAVDYKFSVDANGFVTGFTDVNGRNLKRSFRI